ncbi:helix-turn-helix transcriptional regulator [Streptomyces racemochromogenes]|uniref:Helix-turn-helix transcriptional regulator n=1 Tax=Streptomyces racemochromogenes TaxID=67353 RepID=A0ABW7P886_9ACTN
MSTDPLWTSRHVFARVEDQDPGGLVRIGREALGLRQGDLGARLRCSASTVSRLEAGRHADVQLLRRAAEEVGVPGDLLAASLGLKMRPRPTVERDPLPAQEDPMRRRSLLAAVGLAAPVSLLGGLETALAGPPDPTGSPPAAGRPARRRPHPVRHGPSLAAAGGAAGLAG